MNGYKLRRMFWKAVRDFMGKFYILKNTKLYTKAWKRSVAYSAKELN